MTALTVHHTPPNTKSNVDLSEHPSITFAFVQKLTPVHLTGKGLVPEVAFGEFMASTNFDDSTRQRFTGG